MTGARLEPDRASRRLVVIEQVRRAALRAERQVLIGRQRRVRG